MDKIGILLHVYNLDASGWERLVWGDPAANMLGTGTKFLECLMHIPPDRPVSSIIYSGPSTRDSMSEGAHTKRFLLEHFGQLRQFPRFSKRLDELGEEGQKLLRQRLGDLVLGPTIANTFAEIEHAASHFERKGITEVWHVAAASHAPRCMQSQAIIRHKGIIPLTQRWLTITSDIAFGGSDPSDVIVIEPPHRADDPLLGFSPTLSEVLKPFFLLSTEQKKEFIRRSAQAMRDISR